MMVYFGWRGGGYLGYTSVGGGGIWCVGAGCGGVCVGGEWVGDPALYMRISLCGIIRLFIQCVMIRLFIW